MSRPKLLWVADAVIHSGFARVTHSVLEHLRHTWDVSVLGICYRGDPHPYPYPIYTIYTEGGGTDAHGVSKLPEVLRAVTPDVILVLHDPWLIVDRFLPVIEPPSKLAAYLPVDAPNMKPWIAKGLSKLGIAIFYTGFGEKEAVTAGFTGRSAVIPHGIDLSVYSPLPKETARRALGIPLDAWVVGYAGRNQPRKRLDVILEGFARWIQEFHPTNPYLYLHCDPLDQAGWDLLQLGQYHGIAERLIRSPGVTASKGIPEENLKYIYAAMDVHVNASLGEGWALTTMESMACGIPNIGPAWAGLGDWAAGAMLPLPVHGTLAIPSLINTLGALVRPEDLAAALQEVYTHPELAAQLSRAGLMRVHQKQYRWENVAARFDEELRSLL